MARQGSTVPETLEMPGLHPGISGFFILDSGADILFPRPSGEKA
jgi:hypothetical protein